MKKLIFSFFLCLLATIQSAWGYDFSYTYAGQTLYYNVIDYTSKKVEVYNFPATRIEGSVEIPATVTNAGVIYAVTSIGEDAFDGCENLKKVKIPNSVTSIGDGAFSDCSSLKNVKIPNSVTSIGKGVFEGCSELTHMKIPNSVKFIGEEAFTDCSSLSSFTVTCPSGQQLEYTIIGATSQIVYVDIPEDNTISGALTIPPTVTYKKVTYSVRFINGNTFSDCEHLTSVIIPNSVISIGDKAFDGCSGLTSVTIPNSVQSIGEDAFSGCSSLTSVKIPNSVTSIGEDAFSGCSRLTSVKIPNSVTSIGAGAFRICI